jgi:hypothetical protein
LQVAISNLKKGDAVPNRRGNPVCPKLEPHEAERQIGEFHALGQRVIARASRDKISRTEAAERVSNAESESGDHAQKAQQFADMFDSKALEKLCGRTIRQQDDPEVPDRLKEVRDKLVALQEAARNLNERLKKIASQTRQKSRGR